MSRTTTKPPVTLIGEDGNAFMILGLCRRAARSAGWTDEQWCRVSDEMMVGDYDHLLANRDGALRRAPIPYLAGAR